MQPTTKALDEVQDHLLSLAAEHLPELSAGLVRDQTTIPAIAKEPDKVALLRQAAARVPVCYRLIHGDARQLDAVGDDTVHLVVTSPPY